ncbi:PPP family 3-phenylpropionic acid transporter [Paenibacillus silagei]|uniref:PPP family 3-phenylpropionic acid transporter n=2 Tax=Paenibacillus silagei TaxID=1670801 RepID=A0ABS4NXM5_9BACL|nr:PPP family 3-phenylpropionic acid transporter [Paenibacillus silagei]
MRRGTSIMRFSVGSKESEVLLKMRGLYLFTGLAGGSFNPYVTSLLVHQGMTSQRIGVMMAFGTLLAILFQPLWGILVDRYQRTRLVLMLTLIVPGTIVYLYNVKWLVVIVLVYSLYTIFQSTQTPIADAYAVNAASAAGTSFGTIRLFGSIGTALGGYFGGLYLNWMGVTELWIPFLLFNLLALILVMTIPVNVQRRAQHVTFTSGIRQLLGNRVFLLFLAGCFLVNQTLTAFNSFFVLTFQMAGGSFAWSGIALMIASITSVPAMLVAARVLKKYGYEKTLMLASVVYMLRWAIQWLIPVPGVMIGVQTLHGMSFGFFYIAAVEYVASITGKELQATGQSLFNMVFVGLGGIAGNLLNGYLLETGGPGLMYFSCTVSAALGALLLYKVSSISRKQQSE